MNNMDNASTISNNSTITTVRPLGSTELTLCKALAGGTGVSVICLLFSKHHDTSTFQHILTTLQDHHPNLRLKLRYHPATKTYSFVTFASPFVEIGEFDAKATSTILKPDSPSSKLVQIAEHVMNENLWTKIHSSTNEDLDVFNARTYDLDDGRRVFALQFLSAALDLPAGISLLNELLANLVVQEMKPTTVRKPSSEISVAIEDLNPKKSSRNMWSTGKTLLSTTAMCLALTNLSFKDTKTLPRSSRIIQLKLDQHETRNVLTGCESRGIKVFSALAAAVMCAAHFSNVGRNSDNFGVVTVFDCRSSLHPPQSVNDMGFYSTGLITSHSITKTESFWNIAEKMYATFTKLKKGNKHFSDMDISNYMMCKAIENPGLTPSSSQRTSFLSIFEDTSVIHGEDRLTEKVGLEDFVICASGHGAGPSMTIINAMHDGELKCNILYPFPLHSREQIVDIVEKMKNILVKATI